VIWRRTKTRLGRNPKAIPSSLSDFFWSSSDAARMCEWSGGRVAVLRWRDEHEMVLEQRSGDFTSTARRREAMWPANRRRANADALHLMLRLAAA
jgi:hypothetical protein